MQLKATWNTFKRQYLSHLIAYCAKFSLRLLLSTCKVEVEGLEQFIKLASDKPCIMMLWHNRLGIVSEILYRYAPQFIYSAFVSQSRDGELLAALANSYSFGRTIRVPHNARSQALKRVINNLKTERTIIIFTPDGPRGPKYEVKPGIVLAATEAEATIIPFSWHCDKYWQLNTWDQLRIPKPFSHIRVIWGTPLAIDKQKQDLASFKDRLKEALIKI